KFTITTQPAAPATNGATLATQPVLQLKDQYDNNCDSDGATQVDATATGNGTWTLGGSLPQSASGGVVNYTGLTASSNDEVSAATITFDLGGGSFTLESNSFALGLNSAPSLTAAG
ncbi:hypothetical protein, partial [Marinifilum sp. D714]|uniref:hypothetical protein n=1 Tax=Marinifilum sp. D714 TaxID=2937523 RepID=UPI0027C9AEE6